MAAAWVHLFLDTPQTAWEASVRFWQSATGCVGTPARGASGQVVTLLPSSGSSWAKLQSVRSPQAGVHLDLGSPNQTAAIAHATRLGAQPVWTDGDVATLRSPGGLLFCHTPTDPGVVAHADRSDPDSVLDQVCIDVPPRLWDSEVYFWQQITGRDLEYRARSEFAFLGDPDPAGALRILLQRLDDDAPTVTGHPDFAVSDRVAQACRHRQLGATWVCDHVHWTVMHAPSGHVYCLTDRDPLTGRVRPA